MKSEILEADNENFITFVHCLLFVYLLTLTQGELPEQLASIYYSWLHSILHCHCQHMESIHTASNRASGLCTTCALEKLKNRLSRWHMSEKHKNKKKRRKLKCAALKCRYTIHMWSCSSLS